MEDFPPFCTVYSEQELNRLGLVQRARRNVVSVVASGKPVWKGCCHPLKGLTRTSMTLVFTLPVGEGTGVRRAPGGGAERQGVRGGGRQGCCAGSMVGRPGREHAATVSIAAQPPLHLHLSSVVLTVLSDYSKLYKVPISCNTRSKHVPLRGMEWRKHQHSARQSDSTCC